MYKRTETRPIKVGNVQIGGQNTIYDKYKNKRCSFNS